MNGALIKMSCWYDWSVWKTLELEDSNIELKRHKCWIRIFQQYCKPWFAGAIT
jgi:hypothetical protein